MKITYLLLKNVIGIYRGMQLNEIELFLDSTNVFTMITGTNGSGKTTLENSLDPFAVEAIRPNKKGYKEIQIKHKKKHYIIKHYYEPSKTGHTTKSFIYDCKKGEELNENGNVSSFLEIVKTLLGITPNKMKLLKLGAGMTNLIKMTSSERKKFMGDFIIEAEEYFPLYKKANSDCILINKMLKSFSNRIETIGTEESLKDQLSICEIASMNAMNSLNDSTLALRLNEDKLNKLKEEYDEKEYNELEESIEKLQSSKDNLSNSIVSDLFSIDDSIDVLEQKKNVIIEKNNIINMNITSLENKIEDSVRIMNTNDSMIYDYQLELEKIKLSVMSKEEVEKDIKECNLKLNELNKHMDEISKVKFLLNDDYGRIISEYTHRLNILSTSINNLMEDFNPNNDLKYDYEFDYSKELLKCNSQLSEKRTKLQIIKDQYGLYTKDMGKFNCLDMHCPLKVSTYNQLDFSIDIDEDISKREKEINKLEEYMDTIKIFVSIKSVHKDFILYACMDNILYISNYIELDNKKIQEKVNGSFTFNRENDALNELLRLSNIVQDIKSNNENLALLEFMKSDIDNRTNIQNMIDKLQKERDDNKDTLRESNNLLEEKKYELKENIKILSSIKFIIDNKKIVISLDNKIDRYNELKVLKENYDNTINENKKLIDCNNLALNMMKEVNKKRDEVLYSYKEVVNIGKQKAIFEDTYLDLTKLRDALSTKAGIPLELINSFLNNIKYDANELIEDAFDGIIKLDDFIINEKEFRIPICGNGENNTDVSTASEGERAIISLALSFAILAQSRIKYNVLVLDELDGPLDSDKRRRFLKLIESQMKKLDVEQVFIISHNGLFNDYPLNMILLKGSEDMSKVIDNRTIIYEY